MRMILRLVLVAMFWCSIVNVAVASDAIEKVFDNALKDNRKFTRLPSEINECMVIIPFVREVECTQWGESVRRVIVLDVKELEYKAGTQKGDGTLILDFESKYQEDISKMNEEYDRVLRLVMDNKWTGNNWVLHTSKLKRDTMEGLGIRTTQEVFYCNGKKGFIDTPPVMLEVKETEKARLVSAFQKLKENCR